MRAIKNDEGLTAMLMGMGKYYVGEKTYTKVWTAFLVWGMLCQYAPGGDDYDPESFHPHMDESIARLDPALGLKPVRATA